MIVDIPLLFEGHYESMMDEVATVYVTPDIQLERLMARNNLSEEEALKRINSQLPLEEKKKERISYLIIAIHKKQRVNRFLNG